MITTTDTCHEESAKIEENIVVSHVSAITSSPSLTLSADEEEDISCCSSKDETLPPSLIQDELLLALNKDAGIDELETAVARCKELVLESEQCSVERKWLVRHLIELRLRLQECRDALTDPTHPRNKGSSVNIRVIRGHHLVLQPFLNDMRKGKKHCDSCAATIWSMLQAWYQCTDCGFSCHHKCIPHILRICAHLVATEKGSYIVDICPEKGLSSQKYQCAECRTPLTFTIPKGLSCFGRAFITSGSSSWAEARLCDYDGQYYCTGCHWNSSAVIPARVIHNWDMDKRSVCQASAQLLKITSKQPLIHLEQLNPKLFQFITELSFVKKIRNELILMRRYLSVCRIAQSQHILWKFGSKHHLIDTPNMYSLQDLVDIAIGGELITFLQTMCDLFSSHIKVDCEVCRGRGHLCEICGNDQVIFPFEAATIVCDKCTTCFHRVCWTRKKQICTKCARMREREMQEPQDVNV